MIQDTYTLHLPETGREGWRPIRTLINFLSSVARKIRVPISKLTTVYAIWTIPTECGHDVVAPFGNWAPTSFPAYSKS